MKDDAWLGAVVFTWAAVPPRVRELQTYQQTVIGTGHEPMFLNQFTSQPCESLLSMLRNKQLIRICPSLPARPPLLPRPRSIWLRWRQNDASAAACSRSGSHLRCRPNLPSVERRCGCRF